MVLVKPVILWLPTQTIWGGIKHAIYSWDHYDHEGDLMF